MASAIVYRYIFLSPVSDDWAIPDCLLAVYYTGQAMNVLSAGDVELVCGGHPFLLLPHMCG